MGRFLIGFQKEILLPKQPYAKYFSFSLFYLQQIFDKTYLRPRHSTLKTILYIPTFRCLTSSRSRTPVMFPVCPVYLYMLVSPPHPHKR